MMMTQDFNVLVKREKLIFETPAGQMCCQAAVASTPIMQDTFQDQ